MSSTPDDDPATREGDTIVPRLRSPERLVVFARFPEAGQVKTRLIPALGAEGAARLQEALTRRTLDVVQRFRSGSPCDVEVRFAGGDASAMRRLFGARHLYSEQQGIGLGERLEHAVSTAFDQGTKRVVVIGTDCPELEQSTLEQAFDSLLHADIVLGPAFDGGYYLVGLQANRPELFRGIDWSTENVLRQTLECARQLQCSVCQLGPLSDVDYPEDLTACRRTHEPFTVLPGPIRGLISIIIPTLNDLHFIGRALMPIVGLKNVEVIVVDGGSNDGTVEIARRMGARVVPVRPGRARQMNAGAALAGGEVLLFLCANATLPVLFAEQVWSILNDGAIGGAFHLCIDDKRTGLRWIEWGANLRPEDLQLPDVDQGLFVRSEAFHRIGGFPGLTLMED